MKALPFISAILVLMLVVLLIWDAAERTHRAKLNPEGLNFTFSLSNIEWKDHIYIVSNIGGICHDESCPCKSKKTKPAELDSVKHNSNNPAIPRKPRDNSLILSGMDSRTRWPNQN